MWVPVFVCVYTLRIFFSAQDFVLCNYFDYYHEKWKGGETAQIMWQKMWHETLTRHALYAPSVDDSIVTSPLIFHFSARAAGCTRQAEPIV